MIILTIYNTIVLPYSMKDPLMWWGTLTYQLSLTVNINGSLSQNALHHNFLTISRPDGQDISELWLTHKGSIKLIKNLPSKATSHILNYNYTQAHSTMEYFLQCQTHAPFLLKFGKCSSTASMGTQTDLQNRNQSLQKKISVEQKQRFINLITVQNYNMKEAARIALMSYSTAKKVFTRFRKALRQKTLKRQINSQGKVQCGFIDANQMPFSQKKRVVVVATLAGKEQVGRDNIIGIFETDC